MTQVQKVHLDLDRILETLRRGIRRADVFMGMGLNAAEQHPPPSHILAPEVGHTIQLVKQNLTGHEKTHVAAEFGKWVIANGLRELLETFSIFMHQIYTVQFIILRSLGKLGDLSNVPPKKFERMGISRQLDTIAKTISVHADDLCIVRSLNQARNCYAHRRGRVSGVDVNANTSVLELVWKAFQFEIIEPNGNIVLGPDIYGRVFENGGTVQLRTVIKSKKFSRGDELVVSKQDLKEICLCILLIGESLFNKTVDLAKTEGVLTEKMNDSLIDPKPV